MMGIEPAITHDRFPAQSDWLGRRVQVCFDYDLEHQVGGTIVRMDNEEPGRTILALDNGRYMLATECQYSLAPEPKAAS